MRDNDAVNSSKRGSIPVSSVAGSFEGVSILTSKGDNTNGAVNFSVTAVVITWLMRHMELLAVPSPVRSLLRSGVARQRIVRNKGFRLAVVIRIACALSFSALARGQVSEAPAITGTPGVLTVETAETLHKGVIAVSAFANKYARAPGSVSVLSGGVSIGAGITNKITLIAQFDPYVHPHVAEPSQLSLNFPAGCSYNVYKAPIYCAVPTPPGSNATNRIPRQSSWKGPASAYVPGFPFAEGNTSDYGPAGLGLKVNFWSETRNDPLSVSLRTDFFVPTESAASELAKHGAQSGALDYSFMLGLSKTLRRGFVLATNVTYLVTGNPKTNEETLLTPGDQIVFGQGFIIQISHHVQFLTEYTATFFQEGHAFGLIGIDTQNTSWGPSDPIDGVWGLRWNCAAGRLWTPATGAC